MTPDVEKVSQEKKKKNRPRNEAEQDPVGLLDREVFLFCISCLQVIDSSPKIFLVFFLK